MSGDGTLRKTRSTGDIPTTDIQRPGQVYIASSSRYSESNSDAADRTLPLNDETQDTFLLTVSSTMSRELQRADPGLGQVQSAAPAVVELPEDAQAQATVQHPVHVATVDQHNRLPPRLHNRSLYSRTMAYFGYGRDASRARRSLVALLWNLGWGFVQIVVIISLLALSRHLESPTDPGLSEWKACDRPLGVWTCLWVVRVVLTCGLTYWGWVRDRIAHADLETGTHVTAGQPGRTTAPARTPTSPTSARHRTPTGPNSTPASSPEVLALPHTRLYSRLTHLSSFVTISWFVTAHTLEYPSIHTCRLSSPHLWWLMFGILCIMYLMVLEVILLGFVVFIIAPILFLIWNIFLICIGRHPIQNPTIIKPEIGKLPKSVVDRIPLVMYIPPPPETYSQGPITIPEAVYSYPPKSPKALPAPPKRRFKFSRHISSLRGKKGDAEGSSTKTLDEKGTKGANEAGGKEPQNWEDHWEQGDYPFVRLEGNRAACAICLMDFEEPKRIPGLNPNVPEKHDAGEPSGSAKTGAPDVESDVQEVPVENITQEEREEQLKLLDAGEGAQPLRLLACGHVFHKTCLDPWLTDVSGRCPVCQRAVEVPEPPKKNRRQNG